MQQIHCLSGNSLEGGVVCSRVDVMLPELDHSVLYHMFGSCPNSADVAMTGFYI